MLIVATDTGMEEGRRKAWPVAACFKAELELMPPRRIAMAEAVVSLNPSSNTRVSQILVQAVWEQLIHRQIDIKTLKKVTVSSCFFLILGLL